MWIRSIFLFLLISNKLGFVCLVFFFWKKFTSILTIRPIFSKLILQRLLSVSAMFFKVIHGAGYEQNYLLPKGSKMLAFLIAYVFLSLENLAVVFSPCRLTRCYSLWCLYSAKHVNALVTSRFLQFVGNFKDKALLLLIIIIYIVLSVCIARCTESTM